MSWRLMDERLAQYTNDLELIGVPHYCLDSVATSIRNELLDLSAENFSRAFSVIYPDAASVHDQIVYNWTFSENYFELIYKDDSVNQMAVLAANYLYFVYTQDTYLAAIKSSAPRGGPSRTIAAFLTSDEVRGFRNAFAHGKWRYVGEGHLKSIEYQEDARRGGEILLLEPKKLIFWHLLSKTILGLWTARMADLRQPLIKGDDL